VSHLVAGWEDIPPKDRSSMSVQRSLFISVGQSPSCFVSFR
jgi:hypothetical protein